MASVIVEALAKTYRGGVHAVYPLDLRFENGEFVVLVGPSGCGKSTILNLIAGLERPTGGTVRIGDRDVTADAPRDRNVAMVFQDYALYPHMTVFQNIAFPLRMARVSKQEISTRVKQVGEQLKLCDRVDHYPHQLSGGERQRVALARALVREPDLFLFDEPLSNLDPALRAEVRYELKTLHERLESTFLFVTHDQDEAMMMADRIAVLEGGLLQQFGRPEEVYDFPANVFVAKFFGSPPMNLFDSAAAPDLVESDADLLVGVRPEHVLLGSEAGSTGGFRARIEFVEYLGAENWLRLRTGDITLVAKVDRVHRIAVGDEVWAQVDPCRVLRFDRATGERVDKT